MSQLKANSYNYAVDALRIVAILAVIAIHTTTKNLDLVSHDLKNNLILFIINQLVRFAVPLFFLISGFVLELSSSIEINYFDYLKKRLNRIFLPYFFWSAIYYIFIYTYHSTNYFITLLDGSAAYQLYFIPSLLIFYLIFPFLHHHYSYISLKRVIFLLGFIQFSILSFDYYLKPITLLSPVATTLSYFFSFYLGIILAHYQFQLVSFIAKTKYFILVILFLSGTFVFLQAYSLYYLTHNYLFFYSQHRTSILIYTLAFGGFFYYLFDKFKILPNLIKIFSSLSFFVFFVHVLVLELFLKYVNPHPTAFIFFLAISSISFLIAYIAHKIPYLSKLTG